MTLLYLDTYAGISGDMMLGALIELGASPDALRDQLAGLELPGWRLEHETVVVGGVSGCRAGVIVDEATPHPHRRLGDIRAMIASADLPPTVEADATAVFERLARAETKVHGTTVEEVHFHEVGAVDSIIDVVGACVAMHLLEVHETWCAPLPLGRGFVQTAHGLLPVPAPATLEILTERGASMLLERGEGEMVTPTGAALAAHFAQWGEPPVLQPERVGYGFGTRTAPWPNALRALLQSSSAGPDSDSVVLLECNIDDMTGEMFPQVIERALDLGALDCWTTPIGMKKGRPAVLLSLLAPAGREREFAELLLTHTTTLGVRYSEHRRFKAGRSFETVTTLFGPATVKLKLLDGRVVDAAPEYESCAELAAKSGAPIQTMYNAVRLAASGLIGRSEPRESSPTPPG